MNCDEPPKFNEILQQAAQQQGASVRRFIDELVCTNLTSEIEELTIQVSVLEKKIERRRNRLCEIQDRLQKDI